MLANNYSIFDGSSNSTLNSKNPLQMDCRPIPDNETPFAQELFKIILTRSDLIELEEKCANLAEFKSILRNCLVRVRLHDVEMLSRIVDVFREMDIQNVQFGKRLWLAFLGYFEFQQILDELPNLEEMEPFLAKGEHLIKVPSGEIIHEKWPILTKLFGPLWQKRRLMVEELEEGELMDDEDEEGEEGENERNGQQGGEENENDDGQEGSKLQATNSSSQDIPNGLEIFREENKIKEEEMSTNFEQWMGQREPLEEDNENGKNIGQNVDGNEGNRVDGPIEGELIGNWKEENVDEENGEEIGGIGMHDGGGMRMRNPAADGTSKSKQREDIGNFEPDSSLNDNQMDDFLTINGQEEELDYDEEEEEENEGGNEDENGQFELEFDDEIGPNEKSMEEQSGEETMEEELVDNRKALARVCLRYTALENLHKIGAIDCESAAIGCLLLFRMNGALKPSIDEIVALDWESISLKTTGKLRRTELEDENEGISEKIYEIWRRDLEDLKMPLPKFAILKANHEKFQKNFYDAQEMEKKTKNDLKRLVEEGEAWKIYLSSKELKRIFFKLGENTFKKLAEGTLIACRINRPPYFDPSKFYVAPILSVNFSNGNEERRLNSMQISVPFVGAIKNPIFEEFPKMTAEVLRKSLEIFAEKGYRLPTKEKIAQKKKELNEAFLEIKRIELGKKRAKIRKNNTMIRSSSIVRKNGMFYGTGKKGQNSSKLAQNLAIAPAPPSLFHPPHFSFFIPPPLLPPPPPPPILPTFLPSSSQQIASPFHQLPNPPPIPVAYENFPQNASSNPNAAHQFFPTSPNSIGLCPSPSSRQNDQQMEGGNLIRNGRAAMKTKQLPKINNMANAGNDYSPVKYLREWIQRKERKIGGAKGRNNASAPRQQRETAQNNGPSNSAINYQWANQFGNGN